MVIVCKVSTFNRVNTVIGFLSGYNMQGIHTSYKISICTKGYFLTSHKNLIKGTITRLKCVSIYLTWLGSLKIPTKN